MPKNERLPKSMRGDGVEGKRSPNSLLATLRAIRRQWGAPAGAAREATKDFVPLFKPSFDKIIDILPGKRREAKDLESMIQYLEGGRADICYYQLRAYADFLGIPTSLLLIYSHAVGDAHRGASRDDLTDWLGRMNASILALQDSIEHCSDQRDFFIDTESEMRNTSKKLTIRYNSKIEGLEVICAAYNNSRATP
jgi:hypothetical protein